MGEDNNKLLELYKVKPSSQLNIALIDTPGPNKHIYEKRESQVDDKTISLNVLNAINHKDDFITSRDNQYRFINNIDEDIKKIVSSSFISYYKKNVEIKGEIVNNYQSKQIDIYDVKKYKNLTIILVQVRTKKLDSSNKLKTKTDYYFLVENNKNISIQKKVNYFSGYLIHGFIKSKASPIFRILSKDQEIINAFYKLIKE